MKTKRALIRSIIIVLVAILGLLIYYYFSLMRPKLPVGEQKLEKYTHIRSIYGPSEKVRFGALQGIGVDKNKNIYVTDAKRAKIDIFTRNGDFIKSIGKKGGGKELLSKPWDVAVDDNGDIYITDDKNQKIIVYNKDGKYLRHWPVMMPHFIRINNDKVYLTTYGPLYIYDRKGNVYMKWGKKGRGYSQLNNSYGIVADEENLYIADTMNNRLVSLNKNGNINWALGKPSKRMLDTTVKFQVPIGLTEDENKLLYLADAFDFSIQAITRKGKIMDEFGESGDSDGKFMYPSDIEYQDNRRFAVVDKGNNRVQIIQIPITEKMSKAIEKETGEKVAPTTGESIFERIINFFKTLLGL